MDIQFHPAQMAFASGNVEQFASILSANPELAIARSKVSHPTLLQCLVLTMPAVDSLEDLIDLLASHGAELTDPLIAASGMNNLRAITKLLDRGAGSEGNGRWSPLEEALYWNHAEAVRLLLDRGAEIKNLRTATALGDLERVTTCFDETGKLTKAAGDVSWPFGGEIPEAIRRDPEQIVGNALVYAAAWGRTETVDYLLNHGGQVNLIPAGFDFAGTPLHNAALHGRREMVDQLLQRGADASIRDTKIGNLAEDWAAHGGHRELSEYLKTVRERG
jgi:ankyrin repeat protein